MEKQIPTYKATIKGNLLIFRCPYCKKDHTHGFVPQEKEIHRVAHCKGIGDERGFHQYGYYLTYD